LFAYIRSPLGATGLSILPIHSMLEKLTRYDAWDEEDEAARKSFKPLSRQEAQALILRNPSVGLWQVISAQAAIGAVMALLVWLMTGSSDQARSALYGAACAVVPAALMVHGLARQERLRRRFSVPPGLSAIVFMAWESAKIAISVLMLLLAPKLIKPLSWPALLAGLAACMLVYWFALLWRGSPKRNG
jgi:ATP synthase protein I